LKLTKYNLLKNEKKVMPWINDVYIDVLCGSSLGIVKGVFGILLFTELETEEINNLNQLALSIMEKSPQLVREPIYL
jgi:hypothetical protein